MVAGQSCLACPSVCSTSFHIRCLYGPHLPFFKIGNKKWSLDACCRRSVAVVRLLKLLRGYGTLTARGKQGFFVTLRGVHVVVSRASQPAMSPEPGNSGH
jgi:hypothetical protein